MAKKDKIPLRREVTKRRLARWQKERRRRRIIVAAGMLVVIVILAIVGYGFYATSFAPGGEWVTTVGGRVFNADDYVRTLRLFPPSQGSADAAQLTLENMETIELIWQGAAITNMPGSSKYFLGGFIAYSDTVKKKIVGVKTETLERFGAVSAEVAREMALGVMRKINSDIGVAITGIAGPGGGSDEKPVGTVYIALTTKKRTTEQRYHFKGQRQTIRRSACQKALELLRKELLDV